MTLPTHNNPMSSRRDRDRSFKRSVSLFFLFSMLLVLGTIWLGNTPINPFENKYRLYFITSHVLGIQIETPVSLAGILIGKVENMEFSKDNNIRVTLRLLKRYQERIRGDSHITFTQPMVGNPSLDISLGSADQPILKDGDLLPLERTQEISAFLDRLTPILESVDRIMTHVAILTGQWVDPKQPFQESLRHVAQLTGQSARLMARLETELPETVASVRQTVQQAEGVLVETRKGVRAVPPVLGKAEGVLMTVQEMATHLAMVSRQLEQLAPKMPGLVQQSRDAMQEAEKLMRNVNHSILFDDPQQRITRERHPSAVSPRALPLSVPKVP
ncbi:MAG: MCE family protein [Magnetococcales bacterium]|nr:MCE family protein [Magnetococcales bacterium]NGZ05910.1 MCE family protein [Magnetococcales bacterium]